MVSGLREFLAQVNVGVPVSRLAKWKTALQLIALGILIVGEAAGDWTQLAGETGLWIAAAITIITGYDYLSTGLKYMTPRTKPVKRAPEPQGKTVSPGS